MPVNLALESRRYAQLSRLSLVLNLLFQIVTFIFLIYIKGPEYLSSTESIVAWIFLPSIHILFFMKITKRLVANKRNGYDIVTSFGIIRKVVASIDRSDIIDTVVSQDVNRFYKLHIELSNGSKILVERVPSKAQILPLADIVNKELLGSIK